MGEDLNVEEKAQLNKFALRWYQRDIYHAIDSGNCKRVVLVASRRCLSGNTVIIMANGSPKFLKDIEKGDKILSWDGIKFVTDRVKDIWETGIKKTKMLQSPGYPTIVASPDHKFAHIATSYGMPVRWTKLSEISKRRCVLHYAGINSGSVHNPELAEFWGYMLSDGYVSGYQQPKFTNINIDILNRVAYLATKLFSVTVIWQTKGKGFDIGFSNGTLGGGTFTNPIKELFRNEQIDHGKAHRRLPASIWGFDHDSLLHFFAGLLAGDGNFYIHKKGFVNLYGVTVPPGFEITLSCGSNDLFAIDIYWLLRKIGIVPRRPHKEKGSNWKIIIGKSQFIKKLLQIRVYGKEAKQAEMLAKCDSISRKRKMVYGCYRSNFTLTDSPDEVLYDLETTQHHNFIANGYLVHNSGKDLLAWNLAIRQCIKKTCLILYVLPSYGQARRAIFDAITSDGVKFLDFIPKEFIASINQSEMKIRFKNNSILMLVGGDTFDTSIIGTNPYAVIFSEFSLMPPDIFSFVRPILAANGGWCLINGTPRGMNAFYRLYKEAQELPGWQVYFQPASIIHHIPEDVLATERAQMSEELYQQEFECSFSRGIEGSYYGRYIDALRLKGQITSVTWEPGLLVYTAWDIGVNDATTIIFFSVVGDGTIIRIIDCYSNNNLGLDHYAKIIQDKPYRYGAHYAPHDIKVREFGGGAVTRYEKARQLGLNFTLVDQVPIQDGIETCWTHFPKMWIDQEKCRSLINALENYRREWNEVRQLYDNKPVHSWASNYADSFRYLCLSIHKTKRGMSSEDFERKKAQALYGNAHRLGKFFDDEPSYDRYR
jgi:hypothetical protein